MAKVEFIFNGEIINVLCSENDKMEEICKKFAFKAGKSQNIKKYNFLYSGSQINFQLTFDQTVNSIDRQRKIISILVYDLNPKTVIKTEKIIKSIFPICRECGSNLKFELEDYKIKCSGCGNGHSITMLLNEYERYQKIDISEILCNNCGESKYKTYKNKMYICNSCKINLCPLCHNKHNQYHNLVDYDLKNYTCPKHNESFISYCKTCQINICFSCQKDHNMHDIILIGDIQPDKDDLCIKLIEFRDKIDEFSDNLNKIIDRFMTVKDNLEILYQIYYDMLDKYEDKYRNYEVFMSLNNINNNKVAEELKAINETDSIKNKVEHILNIYEKMNYHVITMIYNVNNEEKIKLFGSTFIENNKDLCSLLYENQEYKLTEYFPTKNFTSDKLEIKLKGINNIQTMKGMFMDCKLLESLPDI